MKYFIPLFTALILSAPLPAFAARVTDESFLKTIHNTGIGFSISGPVDFPGLQNQDKFDGLITHESEGQDNALYEQAARKFHAIKNNADREEAVRLLEPMAYNPASPNQIRAAYTLLRLANASGGYRAVWDLSEKLRTDPRTKDIYYRLEDYRFIALTRGRSSYISKHNKEQQSSVETDLHYLRWLLRIVQNKENLPGQTSETFQQYRKAKAYYHIQRHLMPSLPQDNSLAILDWWLTDETEVNSNRMQAVRIEARNNIFLDWLQTAQVANALQNDWLWALYDPDHASWAQQKSIVAHSMHHYRNGHGPEWLLPAAQRVMPGDPAIPEIIRESKRWINNELLGKTEPELAHLLWSETVRILLMERRYDEALETLYNHELPALRHSWQSFDQGKTRHMTMKWFLHQGEWDAARKMLARQGRREFPYDRFHSRGDESKLILADTPDILRQRLAASAQDDFPTSPLWNLISSDEMIRLVEDKNLTPEAKNNARWSKGKFKWNLIQTAFLRAWLLNDKEKALHAALVADKFTSTGEKDLLAALDGNRLEQASYVLNTPRLRPFPIPFYPSSPWTSYDAFLGKEKSATIDAANPNDNNWWCQASMKELTRQLDDAWEFPPTGTQRWERPKASLKYDPDRFAAERAERIKSHPIWQLSDARELKKLVTIPKGPEYLSNIVNAYASKIKFWPNSQRITHQLPKALHLAVRSTRYGCRRQGSHESYSRKSYEILHAKFPHSIWTKATPYWHGHVDKKQHSAEGKTP